MLTELEAKKIGIKACLDKIGYDFCIEHEDKSCTAYGLDNISGKYSVFVGISLNHIPCDKPMLTHGNDYDYYCFSYVNMETGEISYSDDYNSFLEDDSQYIKYIERKAYIDATIENHIARGEGIK